MNNKPRKHRPLIRWHGGKWKVAPWVIRHLPPSQTYSEVYGGGASVMIRKPRSRCEIYNDLDGEIVHLMRVLQNPFQAALLVRALALTPFARAEFNLAFEMSDDPVERARRMICRSFMGYGSDATSATNYKTGFRRFVSAGKIPAGEWASYPLGLQVVIARMDGVVIEQMDASKLLAELDKPEALHYLDPPYLPSTRSTGNRRRGAGYHVYEHEMTFDQHVDLLAQIRGLSGMAVISGYRSELYDDTLADWRRVERETHADGGRARTEVLWINPAAVDRLDASVLI